MIQMDTSFFFRQEALRKLRMHEELSYKQDAEDAKKKEKIRKG